MDSWWFALEKEDIKKVFEEVWSGKELVIKSIIQRVEGGMQMASWRVLTLGPGTMKDTEYFVAGCQVLIQKVPYRKPKKYPTSTKAQEGVPPSHAANISSEEMQLDPPTPVSKVTESVRKMCIDTRKEPVRAWKPKRPVENVKVSTNTVPLSH